MSTNITTNCTQKSSYLPEISFNSFAIPYEILTQIFSKIVLLKDIHSLLLTNRNINKFILDNKVIWADLLKRHFPDAYDSYDPTQSGFNPIEAYKCALALKNDIKSNGLCDIRKLPLGRDLDSEILAMNLHNDRLTLLFSELNEADYSYRRVAIWDLNNERTMEIPSSIEKELSHSSLYCYGGVIHKDMLYLAIKPFDQFQIQAFDLNNGKQTILHECAQVLDFSKQGNLLYCNSLQKDQSRGSSPSTITIWDMNTGDQVGSQTIGVEYSRAIPYKDSIILHNQMERNIIIWDYKTQEKSIIAKDVPHCHMSLSKDLLFHQSTNQDDSITVFDLADQKKYFISNDFIESDGLIGSILAHAGMFMIHSYTDRHETITISDIETGEKLRERKELSPFVDNSESFFVVHKSKILFGHNASVRIFDFDPLKHYEQKMQKSLTGSLETNDCTELLMLAVMKKDREKILECVDNLVAADHPRNKELIDILCENTEGDSRVIYELFTGTAFDYRKTIQTAPLHLIEKAVFEFKFAGFDQTLPNAVGTEDSTSGESSEPASGSEETAGYENDESSS